MPCFKTFVKSTPGPVARSDARPQVRSSGPVTFFRGDDHGIISRAILSQPLIQVGQLPVNEVSCKFEMFALRIAQVIQDSLRVPFFQCTEYIKSLVVGVVEQLFTLLYRCFKHV